MSELILPNSFANRTKPEAAPHQENFETIEDFVNAELLHADGDIAMTGPLRIPNPKNDHDLVNKQYADGRGTSSSTTSTIARRAGSSQHGPQIGIGAGTPSSDAHAIPRSYVDAATDGYTSGWTTLTLLNGCSTPSGWTSLRYRRFDGVVHLVGRVVVPSPDIHIATLPSGYRPPGTVVAIQGGSYGTAGLLWQFVQSNGQVRSEWNNPDGDYDPNFDINVVFPAA